MDYEIANIYLSESANEQMILSKKREKEILKKKKEDLIKAKNSSSEKFDKQIEDIIKRIANIDTVLAKLGEFQEPEKQIKEDSKFEVEMLLAEKDKIEKAFKRKYPGLKIKFVDFDEDGFADGTARIDFERKEKEFEHLSKEEKEDSSLHFEQDRIEYSVGDKIISYMPYSYFYDYKDLENKWIGLFDVWVYKNYTQLKKLPSYKRN